MKKYCTKTWLNPEDSASTGSVVCYAGPTTYSPEGTFFIEISDCHGKISLHKTRMDSVDDFVKKTRLLISELQSFADYIFDEGK